MAFYQMNPALQEALDNRSGKITPLLEVLDDRGEWILLPPDAVREARFRSYQDEPGCYCVSGEILIRDRENLLAGLAGQNRSLRVSFAVGECEALLQRFTLTSDNRGFVRYRKGGINHISCTVEDIPEKLKREKDQRDWMEREVLVDCVLSDKSNPDQSIVHRIAARAGIDSSDLDSCSVMLPLIYVKLTASPWEELCSLTSAVSGILEGGLDKKLLLSGSPYRSDLIEESEADELPEELFYSLREEEAGDEYVNSVRLRWNRPERLEPCVIWQYAGSPAAFDSDLKPYYPFSPEGEQPILDESVPYEASFEILENYKPLSVLYADALQTKEEVQADLLFENETGGNQGLDLVFYTTESTRALLNLSCSLKGNLQRLTIEGRPIVMRVNQACYLRNQEEIDQWGLRVQNASGKFFSSGNVTSEDGMSRPHYEDWTLRQLKGGIRKKRRFRARSDRGTFHIRAGSLCTLIRNEERIACRVEELNLDYGIDRGMDSQVILLEEKEKGGSDE